MGWAGPVLDMFAAVARCEDRQGCASRVKLLQGLCQSPRETAYSLSPRKQGAGGRSLGAREEYVYISLHVKLQRSLGWPGGAQVALLGGQGKLVEAVCGVPQTKASGARGQSGPRLQVAGGPKPFASPASPLRVLILPGFRSLLDSSLFMGCSEVQNPGMYLPAGRQGGSGKKQSASPRLLFKEASLNCALGWGGGQFPRGSSGGGRGTLRSRRQGGIQG